MSARDHSPQPSAFHQASLVERRGMSFLLPYLESRAHRGRIVSTAGGTLARTLQGAFGDVLINVDADTVCAIEIKIERRWTGNLFLETWSNRNLESKVSHADRGTTPGWLVTTRADVLLFYFLDTDSAIAVPIYQLKRWAFCSGGDGGVYAWPERRQRAYSQKNDTWGRCVPVEVVEREVGSKRLSVRQMELWERGT